jgi:hypothetical protein
LNYVATNDRIVAIFPNGLEQMGLQDLGGAGHLGFVDPAQSNFRYVSGGHGASLADSRWSEMAEFILNGKYPPQPDPTPCQGRVTSWLGRNSPFIWAIIVVVVIGIGALPLLALGTKGTTIAILLFIYVYFVHLFLTKA